MLKSLFLYNFIIIDKIEVDFSNGFSVLTGETGAGKSIILDALILTIGGKASADLVKEKTDKATIIATYVINKSICDLLKEHEVELENNELIIRKVINKNGTTKSFLNDVPVSNNLLKTVGALLLDIHGQFDNSRLLNKSLHLEILDNFVSKEIIKEVSDLYKEYKQALENYNKLKNSINSLDADKEYLKYVIEELKNANVQENEELDLVEKRVKYLHYKKVNNAIKDAKLYFANENNILLQISQLLRQLEHIKDYLESNDTYNSLLEKLSKVYSEILDSEELLNDLDLSLHTGDLNISQIEERISLIRTLAKKHKVTSSDLPNKENELNSKLNSLQNTEENLEQSLKIVNNKKRSFINKATELSKLREEARLYLSHKVNKEIEDLNLKGAKFVIEVNNFNTDESYYNIYGFNSVAFKILNNLSQEAKELNKIASGGELARITLAIKIALAEKVTPLLIIFDEIDVGVGGEVAHNIGKKLAALAKVNQVIAVTHSHQVAALANYHYKVSKSLDNKITSTIVLLNFDERVIELARMISANKITEDAKSIAINLLNQN